MGKDKKHCNYFDKCKTEACNHILVPFMGVLNACANVVVFEKGKCGNEHIIESGWDLDVFVRRSLVDMYVKCGSLEDA